MAFLETACALGTVVGLIGQFASSRKESTSTQSVSEGEEFLVWLHEHDHAEVTALIKENQKVLDTVEEMLKQPHELIEAQLERLESMFTLMLSADPHTRSLSQNLGLPTLSAQARSILRQFVQSGASQFMLENIKRNPELSLMGSSTSTKIIEYEEHRFLSNDLDALAVAGLLKESRTPSDCRLFTITRAAIAFCEADIT
ncbi:hypothetical protein Q4583_07135 [Neptunomonas phycophila]|uniref:hypothetical protein n=1 Tax=Neptunomonas phycophila TaxID=1572645 RepID=UPI001BE9AEB4|nr:hypothetical protein [Neptunomonas phycophila]MBT3144771.1 hypothetical protein [Neptunomonas phycophila]MDO6783882.1 hypothetical protein [Neptunomonas phycophila]